MSARPLLACACAALALGGCATRPQEIGREPTLTPVGSGAIPSVMPHTLAYAAAPPPAFNSLYSEGASLYRDPRAMKPGDVLTILISINDKASLGNNTDRSLDSEIDNKFGFTANGGKTSNTVGVGSEITSGSKSSANGQGTIDRTEKIQVSVAAVVTERLPNGNLVVSGSQEIRVNFEIRQVYVAGIVRPIDISRDNTISYDKVTEARISYGGRGRLTEVQQPAVGQQIYDALKPF